MTQVPIIEGRGGLAAVDRAELLGRLVEHGIVVLRGYDTDTDAFEELTTSVSSRFSCDPAKSTLRRGSDTRKVPTEGYGLNPHNENTFIPGACPDLIWFYCVRPARSGGESIFCSGVDTLASLRDETRAHLTEQPLLYELRYRRPAWQAVYGVSHVRELRSTLEGFDDVDFTVSPLGNLRYSYRARQVAPTQFGGEPALRTNLLSRRPFGAVGSNEQERLADGSPLAAEIVDDVLAATKQHMVVVEQLPGDVVMIDNTRVMHGRRPFDDDQRSLLVRCSWLDDRARDAAVAA